MRFLSIRRKLFALSSNEEVLIAKTLIGYCIIRMKSSMSALLL